MNLGSAILALLIALVVKAFVMVFAARLVLKLFAAMHTAPPKKLWLLLPQDDLPRVRVLWWSLVLFFLSELTCGVELYVLLRSSPILSGFHSVVSGLAMGLFALGLFLHLDGKLFRYGGSSCLLNRFCRGCTIAEAEGCKYRSFLLMIGTFLALATVPPLFASTDRMDADPTAYLLPFPALESWYSHTVIPWLKSVYPAYDPTGAAFYLPPSMLVIEFKLLPLVVLGIAALAIWKLARRREATGLRLLFFGAGVLCYSYFELVCYRVTGDALLGSLFHEMAEFWFLVATAELLIRSFPPGPAPRREGLLPAAGVSGAGEVQGAS